MVKLFVIFFLFTSIFSQEIESTVSSSKINLTESIIYTIKIDDVEVNPEVRLDKLEKSFSIIAGPNVGSEYRYINGKRSSSRSISWTLIPKGDGILIIPSFEVKVGKKIFFTKEFKVEVVEQNIDKSTKDLILEVNIDKTDVVVGEQIVISYKFYTRIASKVISTEFPKYKNFWTEKLFDPTGTQINPDSWEDIEIDGYNYKSLKLYEVSIFPLEEGVFELDSMIMKVETKEKDPSFNRLFWNDPFFDTFSQYTSARILVSDPIKVKVSSLKNIPEDFSGAVGLFKLSSSISEGKIEEGIPAIFTLKLDGSGNLKNIGRPIIKFPDKLEVFEGETLIEKNITDSSSGSISWKYNLIPRKSGIFKITPISLPYYSPKIKKWSNAISNEVVFEVFESTLYDDKDKTLIDSSKKTLKYIRMQPQKWIKIASNNFNSSILFMFILSIIFLIIPYFENSFRSIKNNIENLIDDKKSIKSAKSNIRLSKSILTDGPKIILRYFHLKKKISSDNLDITYFKKEVRGFLKNEDMMFLNDFLDKCKEYSFSNVELEDDNDDQKLELIQFIERVDLYV
tara:strand:- start:4289 stop:5992 length:1704 start_codon:yes stop_codon:yes gene_type:complete